MIKRGSGSHGRDPDKDDEQLHQQFLKQAQRINANVERFARSKGLPILPPLEYQGKSSNARWMLAQGCEIQDAQTFERCYQDFKTARQEERVAAWWRVAGPVIQGYIDAGGFLAQERAEQQVGDWAEEADAHYRNRCLEMLSALIEEEYITGVRLSGEERRRRLRHAAQSSAQCAQLAAPRALREWSPGRLHASEYFLLQAMSYAMEIHDEIMALQSFQKYRDLLRERIPAWTPHPRTKLLLQRLATAKDASPEP